MANFLVHVGSQEDAGVLEQTLLSIDRPHQVHSAPGNCVRIHVPNTKAGIKTKVADLLSSIGLDPIEDSDL